MSQNGESSGVEIRRESGLPIYLQLVDQLRYLIAAGKYRPGGNLPTTRRLADELHVNFNTVNRAYRQLQRDGLIRSTPGKGAVVLRSARSAEGQATALGSTAVVASGDEIDAILLAALERALAAGVGVEEVGARVQGLLGALARRVPPPTRVVVDAGRAWRSEPLARRLSEIVGRSAVAPADLGADASPDQTRPAARTLLVRPRFGVWRPEPSFASDGEVDLPVHLARETIRRLLEVEEGAELCVVAADDAVARWLADATSSLVAPPAALRTATVGSVAELQANAREVLLVEDGLPGLDAPSGPGGTRVALVLTFASSARRAIERAVDDVDRTPLRDR